MVALGKHRYRIMALEATDRAWSGEGIGINIFRIFNGTASLPLKRNRDSLYVAVSWYDRLL